MGNVDNRTKTTVRHNTEMINLWIPLTLLPQINAHAKKLNMSRTKLLLLGAMRMMEDQTEGQTVQDIK